MTEINDSVTSSNHVVTYEQNTSQTSDPISIVHDTTMVTSCLVNMTYIVLHNRLHIIRSRVLEPLVIFKIFTDFQSDKFDEFYVVCKLKSPNFKITTAKSIKS